MRFTQSRLMSLLGLARELCLLYDPGYRTAANLHSVFFCLRDVLEWAWYTSEETSQRDLHQMLCVLPDMLRDILRGVDASLQNRFMPVVYKLEAAQRYDLVFYMDEAMHDAHEMSKEIWLQLRAEKEAKL
jgi:hypothetical protein